MDEIPKQNTGVLEGRRPEDFIAGALPYEERNPSADWRGFLPKEEKQYSDNTDTMGCVSFSANNLLEIQTKFLTGQEANYSDRFLAKMSGTTPQGNWLYKVADTIRNVGLVLEDEWPTPPNYTWQSYYASIPQEVINKARRLNVAYEWVGYEGQPLTSEFLIRHLKQSPLQIVIPKPYPNHAVVLVAIEGDKAYYFDTYPPYLKSIDVSKISSALKIVLTLPMTNSLLVKKGNEYGFYDPATSEDGLITQMRNRGINPPLTSEGKLDWGKVDQMVKGQVV